jgi:hypothetical protein
MLRLKVDNRDQIEKLLNLSISYRDMVAGGMFRQVPISTLATIRYESAYSSINRKNQERVVSLSSNVLNGYNGNEVVGEITEAIKTMDTPQGYEIRMGGEQEDQKETSSFLGIAFLMSLGLILMFSASLLPNSTVFCRPVFLTVPPSAVRISIVFVGPVASQAATFRTSLGSITTEPPATSSKGKLFLTLYKNNSARVNGFLVFGFTTEDIFLGPISAAASFSSVSTLSSKLSRSRIAFFQE